MDNLIKRVLDNPMMVGLLAICFTLSMIGFWRRVKRETSHGYKRKLNPYEDESTTSHPD